MKKLPVGLQLYTVRNEMEKSVENTLKAVKAMGYDYVEPAGLFGKSYAEFKKILDDNGLGAICAHVPLVEMQSDTEGVVKGYKSLGCEYLAVPYLGEGSRPGDAGFGDILKSIAQIGKVCHENGMTLLYHNHDFEFIRLENGKYGLDDMYDTVPKEYLQTELDVCWVRVGGEDPCEYIRKYAGRCPVVHLKDYEGKKTEGMYALIGIEKKATADTSAFRFRPVGQGVQDFPAIIEAAAESGANYVIVEMDESYEQSCLEVASQSREYLKSIGL